MSDASVEDRKTVLLSRVERLRELVEEDAPPILLEEAFKEIERTMATYIQNGEVGAGESPRSL